MTRIQKTVVLGAGTMGARIAAHFANAGLPCLLLDIVPKGAGGSTAERNGLVLAGIEAAKKSKPAAFFTPALAAKISVGNFDDDLGRIADADWIIEVVAEKDKTVYQNVVEKYGLIRDITWMIGNSPKSDINPALAAGLHAIFVPHGDTWILEHEEVNPAPAGQKLLIVGRFAELREHF